jgi:orotate phosphoribosyltransferase
MPEDRIERLKALLKERAVQFGDFELASGARSDVYVDGRLFSLSSAGAALAGELLYEEIERFRPDAVGGMTLGADPVVGAILAHAGRLGRSLAGFLVRKEAKGHGTKKCVEGPRPEVERPRVVVVDDTFTTGGSTLQAAERVAEEWGAEVVAAYCIVDREAGAEEAFTGRGIAFGRLVTLDELR